MLRRAAALLSAVLATSSFVVTAAAQDDWEVQRNPFDPRLVARYKQLLEKNPDDKAALDKLVQLYKRHSKVEKLVEELVAAQNKEPTYARAMVLGHLRRGRTGGEAIGWYEKAAELNASSPAPHLAKGEVYRQQGQRAEASAAYEKALTLTKGKAERRATLSILANLALDANDVAKAQTYFGKIVELDPDDVATRLDLADVLGKRGLHNEALKELQGAVAKLRSDPAQRVEVLARVGREQEALGKTDEAVATYRQAIDLTQRGHHLRRELTERIIEIYRKKQDLRTLIAWCEKTWSVGSRGHFEWDVLARLYESTGEQEKALEAYRRAVKVAPAELDTQRRLIALLEIFGKDKEAVAQYEAVIRIAPGEPRFQIELAERYFRRGDKPRALAMLTQIAGRFPDDPGVHAALADLYSRWGEEGQALKEYERLARIEPDDPAHLVNLGEQHFLRGDKAKAMEVWKRLAASHTPEALARLADVYSEHDLGTEAVDTYLKAIALRPKDPGLYRGLAGVLERQRQDDRAVEAWEKILGLTVGDVAQKALRREARTRIIAILHRRQLGNQLHARINQWKRSFEAKPPDVEAGYFLAEAFLKRGEHARAKATLERLLELDANDLDAMHQLAAVHRSLHEYDEAIALLKKLAEKQPGHEREYYAQIAELEMMLYRDDQAIAYAEKALEKSPNDPQAQERLAEIYEKKEDFTKAIEAYQRAIALSPRNFKVCFALARLQLRRGSSGEAAKIYRDVMRRAPDEETLRTAGHKAIDLEEYLGTLGQLEQDLGPLAFTFTNKAAYRRLLVELYERHVPPLVARARKGDAAARKELEALGERALKPLLEALADESDLGQRRIAVHVLGHLGNKNAAAPLVKFAETIPSGDVSTPASATGRSAPRLRLASPESLEIDLRVEALLAAARLGDARVVPSLVSLSRHREKNVRWAAVWALGRTRDPRALPPLLDALSDAQSAVQAAACIGLGELGERRGLARAAEIIRDEARPGDARAACAWALGASGNPSYLPSLVSTLSGGNDEVQRVTAWALGRLGDRSVLPDLMRVYWGKKGAVREAIAWAVARTATGTPAREPLASADPSLVNGALDHERFLRDLLPAMSAPELSPAILRDRAGDIVQGLVTALGRHRDVVVRVLRELDGREAGLALGPFTAALDKAGRGDREAALATLDKVGAALGPELDKLSDSRDAEIRGLALGLLAKLGHASAPARLERALSDDDDNVRLAALRAVPRWLGATRGKSGASSSALAQAVLARLRAPSWRERVAAADCAGDLGAAALGDGGPLLALLADPSAFVREAAARSLGELRRPDAVLPLVELTRDDVADVRLAATKSLVALGDGRARARLSELATTDPDPRVRAAAIGR